MKEKTVDKFNLARSLDGCRIELEIKDTGNCIFTIHMVDILGWTNDKDLAFNLYNNVLPLLNFNEIITRG